MFRPDSPADIFIPFHRTPPKLLDFLTALFILILTVYIYSYHTVNNIVCKSIFTSVNMQ